MNFQEDSWLTNGGKAELVEGCRLNMVELIDPSTHSWNLETLQTALKPVGAIEALKVPIGWTNQEDKLVWPLTKDGVYTVKSSYRSINDNLNRPTPGIYLFFLCSFS